MAILFRQQTVAIAVCVASLFAAPAAQARALFDSGASSLETATVTPPRAPSWVQVVAPSAHLYAADANAQIEVNLPRNTFLRVVTAGASRLQVAVYDDNGSPVQQGWVDPDQVLPSAPGTDWLVTSSEVTLWSSPDPGATGVLTLTRFAPLVRLDGPVHGRVQVRAFTSDFGGSLGQGWIEASSTGPALPPQMRVPALSDQSRTLRSAASGTQQQAFLAATAQAARDAAALTGVPASVTVAQAILESDWGRSSLATSVNNYFGMKAMGTLGNAGLAYMPTSEYDDSGQLYETVSAFRAYRSLADSLADHDRLLQTASRYAAAMRSANDPKQFAALIAEAGYSTDPAYADKLISLMDRYGLYQLDA